MIRLDEVTKAVGGAMSTKKMLTAVSLDIPTDRRIALLGRSATDKRTLIDMMAGVDMPNVGRIVRHAQVSFPVGSLPGFTKELSVRVNVAHVARLYNADVRKTLELVEYVSQVRRYFDRPYDELPRTMRRPLAQVIVFSLPFDVYLLTDDKLPRQWSTEQARRKQSDKANDLMLELFAARMNSSGMIIPTENEEFARQHCELGLFLEGGRLVLTEDIGEHLGSRPERRGQGRRGQDRRQAREQALAQRQNRMRRRLQKASTES
jgi:capsular polysaccharide transport system ATP-binding protein